MGRSATIYIYSHRNSLSLMKEKVGVNIVRPGTTRLTIVLLSLSSIQEMKKDLRQMFTYNKWIICTLSETDAGKKVHI